MIHMILKKSENRKMCLIQFLKTILKQLSKYLIQNLYDVNSFQWVQLVAENRGRHLNLKLCLYWVKVLWHNPFFSFGYAYLLIFSWIIKY